jgi:hypothetical protein
MCFFISDIPSAKPCERKRTSSICEAEPGVSVAKRSKSKASSRKKAKESEKQIKVTRKNIAETDEVSSPPKTADMNEGDMTEKTDESKGKTLLEILELEMRARAIRALLKQQIGAGDSEDAEQCDERSETSPSELKKSPSLYTVEGAASSYNSESSKGNLTGSHSFDINPKSSRQKLKHKGMRNIPQSQCTVVNTENTNNLCFAVSPKLSLDVSAVHQLSFSTQNGDLCTFTKTYPTVDPDVGQAANENISQSSSCRKIKTEVCHGGKTRDTDSVKHVSLLESNCKEQELNLDMPQIKQMYETLNTAVTFHEGNIEDGELSNDDKSSKRVLEVQSERGCNDIIILDDDEVSELHTSSNLQKTLVQQTDNSQKMSLENLSEPDNFSNDSCTSTDISGTLNTASKECNVKPHKSSVSYKTSGSTPENLAQTENNEFSSNRIETEVNEDYRSENQKKGSDSADCSWATRWLQSKDVQKVVSTSKMCAKIRKRMKCAQKVKRVISLTTDPKDTCSKSSVVVMGSVNEYNMLDNPNSGDGET